MIWARITASLIWPGRHIGIRYCLSPQEQLIAIANDFWAGRLRSLIANPQSDESTKGANQDWRKRQRRLFPIINVRLVDEVEGAAELAAHALKAAKRCREALYFIGAGWEDWTPDQRFTKDWSGNTWRTFAWPFRWSRPRNMLFFVTIRIYVCGCK
jgi:hypothetical protein